MAEPWEVVVVGSCMIDLVSYAPRLPKSGETLPGTKFVVGFGGKGCNQAVAARKMGAKTLMVGRLGNDTFGKEYLKQIEESGMSTDHIRITDGISSGMAQITVSETGENQIVIVQGANGTITENDVEQAADAIKNCKVLICELEITPKCTIKAMQMKKQTDNGLIILNAAPAQANLEEIYYKLPDIFCVNETETEIILGKKVTNVDEAAGAIKEFIRRGCKKVIITLGEQGAVYGDRDTADTAHIPAVKVNAVDSTGAGDAFIGALAFYLAKKPELTIVEMIKRACDVASLSVQKVGTQASFPSSDELPSHLKI